MIVSKGLIQSQNNKFTILKRQRISHKFWRSSKSDEIIFINAPMFYGKTTAVNSAMEELHKKYIYIRFDPCMNNFNCFCGYMLNRLEKFNGNTANKKDTNSLIFSLGKAKNLDAIIFDDFQICKGQMVINTIKSIYKLYGEDIQIILISRSGLPESFSGWQYESKIITINEETLAFSDSEIKKLAEQNKIYINNTHARCLLEKSSGCIGFIEEELHQGKYFNPNVQLPLVIHSCIECVVSNCNFNKTLNVLFEFMIMNEIPSELLQEICGENSIEKIKMFSRETGLIKLVNGSYILHPLLKTYIKNTKKGMSNYDIYDLLVSKNDYKNALQYAVTSGNKENIINILQKYLYTELTIPEYTLEKIYRFFKENPTENEAVNYYLFLFEAKSGSVENIKLLLSASERYPGIRINLKEHVFTVVYPHINAESGFITSSEADKLLIECGKLYDDMQFSDALNILNQARIACSDEVKPAFFCLLINTLRNLYMYTAAENELKAFEEWISDNLEYYDAFEDFRIEMAILGGDKESAREWLSVNNMSLNKKIYRNNVEKLIIDALAFIAIGETEAALYRLKNINNFAEIIKSLHLQIESLTLLAIVYQEKGQTKQAVYYMEKAISIADWNKKTAVISKFGKDICFLIERCYLRVKKKNDFSSSVRKLLLHIKNEKMYGGLLPENVNSIKLSERQQEMLVLLSENYTYNQIAEVTDIKITTVRDHIKKLYEKLEVRNAADAVVKAKEKGLI